MLKLIITITIIFLLGLLAFQTAAKILENAAEAMERSRTVTITVDDTIITIS